MILRTAVVAFMAFVLVGAAESGGNDATRKEMKKLDWLVGEWKGTGWIQAGPERQEFVGTETVRRKVGGLSLLIDGRFTARDAAPDAPPVHETLGVLWFDASKKHYWLNAWLHTGRTGQFEARAVSENVVHWFIPIPQGQIRYTMRLDEQNRWAESGEMSPDGGKTWRKFFEMTLEKAADRADRSGAGDAVEQELAQMQGDWTMYAGLADGQAVPEAMLKEFRRACQGDVVTTTLGGEVVMKATIRLDPTKSPKTIDYVATDGPTRGQTHLGVYVLQGGTFKSCFAAPGAERPTDFTTEAGDGRTATAWRRVDAPGKE